MMDLSEVVSKSEGPQEVSMLMQNIGRIDGTITSIRADIHRGNGMPVYAMGHKSPVYYAGQTPVLELHTVIRIGTENADIEAVMDTLSKLGRSGLQVTLHHD